jgi:hypothetical protein
MGLGGLQPFTIEPADLKRSREFYYDVARAGEWRAAAARLPGLLALFRRHGHGSSDGHALPREGIVVCGPERKYENTGRFDRIAFAVTDVEGMCQRLQSKCVNSARASSRARATRSSSFTIPMARRRTEVPKA